jgi:hypothetical protein
MESDPDERYVSEDSLTASPTAIDRLDDISISDLGDDVETEAPLHVLPSTAAEQDSEAETCSQSAFLRLPPQLIEQYV